MKTIVKIIVFVIVGVILFATFRFLWNSSRPEEPKYEVISPTMGNIDYATTITGNIEPRNKTAVKPEIPGIILKILKKVGDHVQEGEIIATLRVITDAGQLNTAESRVRQSDIALDQVSKEYERQRELFDNDVISRNDYEAIQASYRKAVEENENAIDALQIVKSGASKNIKSVNNTQIRSRSSGTILDIPVKEGNMVIYSNAFNEGTTIATVANMKDLIFRGTIDETEVGNIHEGMPISISIGAIPSKAIDAVIEYISPEGKKENGSVTYEIKAAVKLQPDITLRSNYSATANVVVQTANDIMKIPESAVEFSKSGIACVYILKNDSKNQTFIKRLIEIGLSDGSYLEVKSGLNQTDQIRGAKIDSIDNK
jgi:HlyD family secretion protein